MASETFKELSIPTQRLLVGKFKSMYDAGYEVQAIKEKLNISEELAQEIIKMILITISIIPNIVYN